VTTLMVACGYGAAFGSIQMIPQIVPGLADVREAVRDRPVPAQKSFERQVATEYTKVQEIGGLLGRFALAFLAARFVSRRRLLAVFQIPGLFVLPVVFALFLNIENRHFFDIDLRAIYLGVLPITTMSLGVMLCGLLTVAQFSFWGNYLPLAYPLHLRGTGESVAANIGGRMIGTSFAALTSYGAWLLSSALPGDNLAPWRFAYVAAGIAFFVYLCGNILRFFLPEPSEETLRD